MINPDHKETEIWAKVGYLRNTLEQSLTPGRILLQQNGYTVEVSLCLRASSVRAWGSPIVYGEPYKWYVHAYVSTRPAPHVIDYIRISEKWLFEQSAQWLCECLYEQLEAVCHSFLHRLIPYEEDLIGV